MAAVWHDAWHDAHAAHVPAALLPYRSRAYFAARVPAQLASTTVGLLAGIVTGFVTTHDDELDSLFLAAHARGTGLARALLRRGEQTIAQRFANAWLQVTSENTRARRFYEREGWHDAGPIPYQAEVPGQRLPIACRRYVKHSRASAPPDGYVSYEFVSSN